MRWASVAIALIGAFNVVAGLARAGDPAVERAVWLGTGLLLLLLAGLVWRRGSPVALGVAATLVFTQGVLDFVLRGAGAEPQLLPIYAGAALLRLVFLAFILQGLRTALRLLSAK